jgi:hypothetical protein
MSDYANMFESIRSLASSIHAINQKAVREYTPVVEAILRSPIPDNRHIECTLDGLLDFCGYETALHLYKKLCHYYYYINPTATVEYVEAYRELWDSDQQGQSHDCGRERGEGTEGGSNGERDDKDNQRTCVSFRTDQEGQ